MSIYEEWRKRRQIKKLEKHNDAAFKRFKEQKQAINDIRNSKGLEEIMTYFKNVEDSNTQKVLYSAENERERLIARATVAKEFRRFIENLFMADEQ